MEELYIMIYYNALNIDKIMALSNIIKSKVI